MLITWTTSRVSEERREDFERGRSTWRRMLSQNGFQAQLGGWDTDHRARVLALWSSVAAYRRFRDRTHDELLTESGEAELAQRRTVASFEGVQDVAGEALDLPEAMARARCARVVTCLLHPGQAEHFLDAQRHVWRPALTMAADLLGAVVARNTREPHRMLLVSLWSSRHGQEFFANASLPRLARRSDAADDVLGHRTAVLDLEPAWRVVPHDLARV